MSNKDSILSQDPEFYSAYEYEEQEESDTQRVFIKVLLQLLLVLSILWVIYFAFNYISNMDIDFKKNNFWGTEKQSKPPIHEIKKEQKIYLKSDEVEPIVKKVIEELHQEKVLEVSKIELEPIVKPTKEVSREQEKKPYLVDEYLEAIKKELGKN